MNNGRPIAAPLTAAGILSRLTGAAILAAGAMLYGAGTSQLATLAPPAVSGSTRYALSHPGGSVAPSWSNQTAWKDQANTFTGIQTFGSGTASTSTTTGAVVVSGSGGVGIGGALNIGSTITSAGLNTIDLGSGAHITNAAKGSHLRIYGADSGNASIGATLYNNVNGFLLQAVSCGGTRASPTATPANTIIFQQIAYGHDGTGITGPKGYYFMGVPTLWSGTNNEVYHSWSGTQNGSTTSGTWMTLKGGASDPSGMGALGIGVIPTTGNGLLQVASGTTQAHAIGFGTDTWIGRSAAGTLKVFATTASTSTTTGALVVTGGVGIGGTLTAYAAQIKPGSGDAIFTWAAGTSTTVLTQVASNDFVWNVQTANGISLRTNSTQALYITSAQVCQFYGGIYMVDGKDIDIGVTTGSRIGTGATAKIGFYGATPVVQRTLAAAATDAATTQTLANSLRTALLDLGLGA